MEFGIWNESKFGKTAKLTVAAITAVLIAGAALIFVPHKSGIVGKSMEFVIEEGQTLNETAELLAERDFVISRHLFVAYAVLTGNERKFKAGRYILPTRSGIYSLVKTFSQGRAESEDTIVTIPEGTNISDIDLILSKTGLIRENELLASALEYEGYLFPDTYRIKSKVKSQSSELREASQEVVEEIIRKMSENFEIKTVGLFQGLSESKIRDDVIVASMLEKEVQSEEDMRLVAGIMANRQKLGMPLEIDATVSYGVCLRKFVLGEYCDVSLANIVDNIPLDSAYNTYKRRGLPAGPISNPGLA